MTPKDGSSSIKLVFQRNALQSKLKIKEVEVKETKNIDQVETAVKALKAKVKNPRRLKQLKLAELVRLDGKGNILESQVYRCRPNRFVDERAFRLAVFFPADASVFVVRR